MSKNERRRTRVSSTIDKLPDDIKGQLDVKLSDTTNTYEELSVWLKSEGYEISKSAIGRYAIRTTKAAQRVAETIQRTQAIAQAVEAHPDLDYTKAASMVLMDGLMQRVSTAEDDFQEMPLDKAGRLIASLARNATYEKRVRADLKKKAELAELELNGVSLLVRSSDANLTPQFIGRLFGIDASAVNVIGAETDSACDRLVTGQTGRADAYVATKGRVESMMSVVSACIDEKKNISFIVAMQNAAVVIGFVLVAFLTFIAGVSQISSFALFVYELFWIVAAVILPRFKNKIK